MDSPDPDEVFGGQRHYFLDQSFEGRIERAQSKKKQTAEIEHGEPHPVFELRCGLVLLEAAIKMDDWECAAAAFVMIRSGLTGFDPDSLIG